MNHRKRFFIKEEIRATHIFLTEFQLFSTRIYKSYKTQSKDAAKFTI